MDKKLRIKELQQIIDAATEEMEVLNPFYKLKLMSNKKFGEEWSESYIRSKCPNLEKANAAGHDMYSKSLGFIEVKSTKLPCQKITFNQIHPQDADNFLFVMYDTINGDTDIFLVPTEDIQDSSKFSLSAQHTREKEHPSCFSMRLTKKNAANLENYRIENWEVLNGKAGIR